MIACNSGKLRIREPTGCSSRAGTRDFTQHFRILKVALAVKFPSLSSSRARADGREGPQGSRFRSALASRFATPQEAHGGCSIVPRTSPARILRQIRSCVRRGRRSCEGLSLISYEALLTFTRSAALLTPLVPAKRSRR
jgi:hypothetical protein